MGAAAFCSGPQQRVTAFGEAHVRAISAAPSGQGFSIATYLYMFLLSQSYGKAKDNRHLAIGMALDDR